jgi:hypothetical protein
MENKMKNILILGLIGITLTACNDPASGVPADATKVPPNASDNKIAGEPVQAALPQDQQTIVFDSAQGMWVAQKIGVGSIDNLQADLDSKANSADVASSLALLNQGIASKAEQADLVAGLSTKVNNTDFATNNIGVQGQIAAKSNTADVNTALGAKVNNSDYSANNTIVQGQIAAKANTTDLTNGLAGKASTSALTTGLAGKVDTTTYAANNITVQGQIAAKANTTDLSAKLDKAGGTLTGDIQLANKNAAAESAASGAYVAADAGKTWYNGAVNALKFWNGTATKTVATTDDIVNSQGVTDAALAAKLNTSQYNTDQVSVQNQISAKADTTTVNNALATKADATTVTNQLATKVDSTQYATDKSNTATAISAKANTSDVNTALALKANTASLGTLAGLNSVGDANITGVAGSKVTGNITGNAASITGTVPSSQVTGLGTLAAQNSVSDSNITGVAGTKVTGNITGNAAGFTGTLSGDVSGTQGATSVDKIKGYAVSAVAPIANKVLKFISGVWTSAFVDLSETTGSVTDSQVTAVSGTKVTGNITGSASTITGTITSSQVTGTIPSTQITGLGTLAGLNSVGDANITGVAGSKVTGNITGNAASITGTVPSSQVTGLGTLAALNTVADSNITGVAGSKITGTIPAAAVPDLSSTYATTSSVTGKVNKAGDTMSGALAITAGGLSVAGGINVTSGSVIVPASSITANAINNASSRFVETTGNFSMNGNLKSNAQISFQTYNNTAAAGSVALDWNLGQMQTITVTTCGTFTFSNMLDGGTYSLAVNVTNAGTCAFATDAASGSLPDSNFKALPDKTVTAGKTNVFSFLRMGSTVYITSTGPF